MKKVLHAWDYHRVATEEQGDQVAEWLAIVDPDDRGLAAVGFEGEVFYGLWYRCVGLASQTQEWLVFEQPPHPVVCDLVRLHGAYV